MLNKRKINKIYAQQNAVSTPNYWSGYTVCFLTSNIISDQLQHKYTPRYKSCLTIGNPPFGKNSSLAISFFNKAAEFSDIIAFILPQTFSKDSVKNRLNLSFFLIMEVILND